MASDSPKVFISYSHDSPEHRQHVLGLAERLRTDGVDAEIDQYVAGTPEEGWPRWMLNRLDWADFVLVVCTETYYRRFRGHELPGSGKGADWEGNLITLGIYNKKSRTTKFVPVLFKSEDETFIPEPLSGQNSYVLDSEERYDNLYAFLVGQAGVLARKLGSIKTLAHNPAEMLRFGNSEVVREAMGKLYGVPDLPPHYLTREANFVGLKQKLVAKGGPVAITGQSSAVGVQGMGGIGKSVLAAALARDLEARRAFPDGIFWLTIGQKPNLLLLQGQLLRQLTGSDRALTSEREGKDALREALEGQRSLVVIDDVWSVEQADTFSVTAAPARLLVTTRNREVLVGLGAEEHCVGVLSSSDARRMLANWVGGKNSEHLPSEATEIAKECGYLPLALAMIGAMVHLSQRQTAWQDALTRLRNADLGAFRRVFPGYPYPDLLRAVEVSIDALEPADRERYLDLAVFPQNRSIPESALRVLWRLDEIDTRECMTQLVARSLATWMINETSLILHDLQRDIIRKRREKELPGLHGQLVDAWGKLTGLTDDYAWRRVAWHLKEAGREPELKGLLLNFNWLEAKLEATNLNALMADYDYLADDADLRLVQSALRLSAHVLARDRRQLPAQLTGRLLGNSVPGLQVLLEQAANRKVWPWLRPLKSSLTPPGSVLVSTLQGHRDLIHAIAIAHVAGRAVSASKDGTLRVWDLESGQTVHSLHGHIGAVTAVAVTPEGDLAVSGSTDRTLRVWNIKTVSYCGHSEAIRTQFTLSL